MNSSKLLSLGAVMLIGLGVGCGSENDADDHGPGGHSHAHEGPHGGHMIEVGTVAHLEVLHDADQGRLRLYCLGADALTALPPDTAPTLVLATDADPLNLLCTSTEGDPDKSTFLVEHAALKTTELSGRVRVVFAGKTHQVQLEHDH